jgi:hypothetical protein
MGSRNLSDLPGTIELLAVKAAVRLFERFNWQHVSEEMVTQLQARILNYI